MLEIWKLIENSWITFSALKTEVSESTVFLCKVAALSSLPLTVLDHVEGAPNSTGTGDQCS